MLTNFDKSTKHSLSTNLVSKSEVNLSESGGTFEDDHLSNSHFHNLEKCNTSPELLLGAT